MNLVEHEPTLHDLSLEEFDRYADSVDRQVELVEGVAVVVPLERWIDRDVAYRVARHIESSVQTPLLMVPDGGLTLERGRRATARIPDLVICRRDAVPDLHARRPSPAGVLLVVEVTSPSSRATDLVHKAHEYARAGIPLYLVIDPQTRRITRFGEAEAGVYGDVVTAATVELTVEGASIVLAIDDLIT